MMEAEDKGVKGLRNWSRRGNEGDEGGLVSPMDCSRWANGWKHLPYAGQGKTASLGMVVRPEPINLNLCLLCSGLGHLIRGSKHRFLKSLWQSTNYKNPPASRREKTLELKCSQPSCLHLLTRERRERACGGPRGRHGSMACRLLLWKSQMTERAERAAWLQKAFPMTKQDAS